MYVDMLYRKENKTYCYNQFPVLARSKVFNEC